MNFRIVHPFYCLNLDYDTILTVFLMMGKCFSAGVFGILYVYSAELFPTVVRSVGVGCCSMSARISGLLQPQVALAVRSLQSRIRDLCTALVHYI